MVKKIDNAPLTLAQLLSTSAPATLGLHVFMLGEDGEQAVVPFEPGTPERPLGSGDLTDERLSRALAASDWGSGDPADYQDGWTEGWALFTPHADGCRDDLDDDEDCACECSDFQWWAAKTTRDTPGALRVMWWSV